MYGFSTSTNDPVDESVDKTTKALGKERFGVITEFDVQATLRNMQGPGRLPYKNILAYQALKANRLSCGFFPAMRWLGRGKRLVRGLLPGPGGDTCTVE